MVTRTAAPRRELNPCAHRHYWPALMSRSHTSGSRPLTEALDGKWSSRPRVLSAQGVSHTKHVGLPSAWSVSTSRAIAS